ncbi:MAG: phosphate signaling complex protein PhoU [Pseudomonadota bacterium]
MHESPHILELKKKQIDTSLGSLFLQVKNAIAEAMNCLADRNHAKCETLVRNDLRLNELRRNIEQDCLVAIASQQPVAHDLRDLVADMRMAAELERMGDYASDIAASIAQMDAASLDAVGAEEVQEMSVLCRQMLTEAMHAHQSDDTEMARKVAARDDELDAHMRRMVDTVLEAMRRDPALVNNGSRMLWVAHNLERCGDRATNIAEQVLFRVDGTVEDLD